MSFLRERFDRRAVGIILFAAVLYLAAVLVPSAIWLAAAFLVAAVIAIFWPRTAGGSGSDELETLKKRLENISEGNLQGAGFADANSGSTFGEVHSSVHLLTSRLRQIVNKVKYVSGSVSFTSDRVVDLSRSLLKGGQSQATEADRSSQAMQEISGAIQRIAQGVDNLNQVGITASSASLELTASIEEVTKNARQVGGFARETQTSMEGMVKGMREIEEASDMLTGASRETSASMQNMHRQIQEVTRRAKESDELAERAATAARMGSTVVAEVEAGISQIADAFQRAGNVIGGLAMRSEQIGEILVVINQIADQTNLLSLNAAILSAQAGVHGKGFAVVADEIRKLSQRTASSVHEIEALISQVRTEMRDAVQFMENGKEKLTEGLDRSGKASDALSEILAATTSSREKASVIVESCRGQIQAEAEVQKSTATIQQRVEQISRVIKDRTRVSHEVNARAARMIDLMKSVEAGMEEQTHGAKEVSKMVERLSEIIRNIHVATSEQSITSRRVLESVESLRAAVQSGISTIRSLNSMAFGLDQEAYILTHQLASFRLPEPQSGGSMTTGTTAHMHSMDPAYARHVQSVEAVFNVYEGLVEYGEGTDIHPVLADKWSISDDGLVWTFRLKRGVRFHNGKEMTSADVRDSFTRILNPATKSPGTWIFDNVEGVAAYRAGKAKTISGFATPDPLSFQIRLTEPIPFLLGMLTQAYAFVLPSELARPTEITELCGTGPFRVDRFVSNQLLELSRFDRYHAQPVPYLDRVTIRYALNHQQIYDEIKSGKMNFTTDLDRKRLEDLMQTVEWRARVERNVQLHTAFVVCNVRIPPLNDQRVRQAIAYAIDRERLVREVLGAQRATVARSLIPPGMPGHDEGAVLQSHNPARARALLQQAGVGSNVRLELWQGGATATASPELLVLIQQDLKEIGLDVKIVTPSSADYERGQEMGTVPLRVERWVADYPDPDNFLYVTFHPSGNAYNLGYDSTEFKRLTEEARCLADARERIKLYQRAERVLLEEAPCAVLFHSNALLIHQENLQGCVPHFTSPVVRLKKVWLNR